MRNHFVSSENVVFLHKKFILIDHLIHGFEARMYGGTLAFDFQFSVVWSHILNRTERKTTSRFLFLLCRTDTSCLSF